MQFLGGGLGKLGAGALAHLDLAREDGHDAIGADVESLGQTGVAFAAPPRPLGKEGRDGY